MSALPPTARKGECEGGTFDGFPHSRSILSLIHIYIRRLRLHHLASKRVLLIGIPSGLQNAIFAVANLFVQAGLNSFDEILSLIHI